jgi:Secretion system C-terminal sorting domain
MKKLLLFITFTVLTHLAFAQTYCIGYDIVSTSGGNFVIDVKLQGSAAFELATSTLIFTYNGSSLSNPTLVTDYLAPTMKYLGTTVVKTNPSMEGLASISVFLSAATGTTIAAANSWTPLCRITFGNTGVGNSNLLFSGITEVFKLNYSTTPATPTQISNTAGCAGVNVPLPIELTAFGATKVKQTSEVKWSAINAVNIHHFEVEKSVDGVRFDTIGKVKAFNVPDTRTYQLTDAKPFSGINYYRLKIVEMDGKVIYSKIVSLIFETDFSANVYPNPMHDDVTISITSDKTNGEAPVVTIFDAIGRQVLNKTIALSSFGTANTTILTNELPNGTYILTIKNGETVWHQKMVKQ